MTIHLLITEETREAAPKVPLARRASVVTVASVTVLMIENDPLVWASTSEFLREAGRPRMHRGYNNGSIGCTTRRAWQPRKAAVPRTR